MPLSPTQLLDAAFVVFRGRHWQPGEANFRFRFTNAFLAALVQDILDQGQFGAFTEDDFPGVRGSRMNPNSDPPYEFSEL